MSERTGVTFDIEVVHDRFAESLHDEDDVLLRPYLDSYHELDKFFHLMGSVFGFVSSDVVSKMEILTRLLEDSATGERFRSVKSMITYESESGLLEKKGYVSGSRTLLRLHRGLDFIREFMRRLGELQECEGTAGVCREAYDSTLAHHHPWLLQTGARIAMYTLPSREQLLRRVCGDEPQVRRALDLLPDMLRIANQVYERVHHLYTAHDLLKLP